MGYIVLYWGVLILGYFLGSKNREKSEKFAFTDKIIMGCVSGLVFLMGIRMGSNEDVISNIGSIGIKSVIVTVILMAGAALAVTVTRRIFKMDKYGLLPGVSESDDSEAASDLENEVQEKSSNVMTWLILGFVIAGLLVGYFYVRTNVEDIDEFNSVAGVIMTAGLTVMLFLIGLGLGFSGTVVKHMKTVGLRVLAFPLAVVIGTTAAGLLVSVIFGDLSVKESLAISYGFGWYTFAPVSISNAGYEIAGAISFMHNVFRELGGMVLLPILASKIGYIEVTALPGVAGMDICIPIVEKVCRQDIIVYSFAIGMVESLLVPLLVPMIIGL